MGANPTQALSVLCFLIAFVLLAAAFAGDGLILAVAALILFGAAVYFSLKCKPWEAQGE